MVKRTYEVNSDSLAALKRSWTALVIFFIFLVTISKLGTPLVADDPFSIWHICDGDVWDLTKLGDARLEAKAFELLFLSGAWFPFVGTVLLLLIEVKCD